MTLQTPRRRISPRTKHRYRVIRNFFRKALGTASQPDIKISSSIAINVSDLKHRITGLHNQLSDVNKHCQEFGSTETFSKHSNSIIPIEQQEQLDTIITEPDEFSDNKLCAAEDKVLYKTSDKVVEKFDDSDTVIKLHDNSNGDYKNTMNSEYKNYGNKSKKKKSKVNDSTQNLHKRKDKLACENLTSAHSAYSFHSNVEPRTKHRSIKNDCYDQRQNYRLLRDQHLDIASNHKNKGDRNIKTKDTGDTKTRKNKHHNPQVDEDFIADIIKKQYKPMKVFGRRESDISQVSTPLCRDREYSIRDDIIYDPELSSSDYYEHDAPKSNKSKDLHEIKSVCDTHLHNTKKHTRPKTRRRYSEAYNDSDLYDVVPVKEKSSPKSRKKIVEDIMDYNCYREVPPSPRTHRPRLNLKAQNYDEFEEILARKDSKIKSHSKLKRSLDRGEGFESNETYVSVDNNKISHEKSNYIITEQMQQQIPQQNITINSSQDNNYANLQNAIVDTTLNKNLETELSTDKTDKALYEIKDILQSFLQEIKKDGSQNDKPDIINKSVETDTSNHHQKPTASIIPDSGDIVNNNNITHCGLTSFVPPLTNPCCYPILPVCPINCLQNGFIVPNSNMACSTCESKNEVGNEKPTTTNNNATEMCSPETEQLIKEIYKYVAQSPREKKKECQNSPNTEACKEVKLLTSRSAGDSTNISMHDAKLDDKEIPAERCYSKSCETIGSQVTSNTSYSSTNLTYSDVTLQKLSLDPTPNETLSASVCTDNTTPGHKSKKNRFAKLFRSFGIKKKKKKDVLEEISESESATDVEVRSKAPPLRQDMASYSMHGQEYIHPPPVPPMHAYQDRPYIYQDYRASYAGTDHQSVHEIYSHPVYQHSIHEQRDLYPPAPVPTAPPYSHSFDSYNPPPPIMPLCFKEIEVASIGTQSERKVSFFKKIKTKMQVPVHNDHSEESAQKNCSTQTKPNKPGLFNWKGMQNKTYSNTDPMSFAYLQQKHLAEGDNNIRDVMLKKLLYKKNPFSPKNLLVKSLLGKEKSGFGETPTVFAPKMFF